MRQIKYIMPLIFLGISFNGLAQAHIGSSLAEIKSIHSDKVFEINYTDEGQKYATAKMYYGTFAYYFDSKTGLSDYCIQIPFSMNALNAQVEAYNKKYVIVSETSWKAYLEGGGIMHIELEYNEDHKLYMFKYYQ